MNGVTTLVDKTIPLAKPWIGEAEYRALRGPLESGWLTQGPEVEAFEREFAEFVGAPYACAVCNCTAALHLALTVAGVGEGDGVITVSHTFIAVANAIRQCGATPSFVDIAPDTFNMNPRQIESAVTPRTKAILCVHQMGMPCDISAISRCAKRLGLPLIEDAACAVGSALLVNDNWEHIGKPHGDLACFSFHPRKLITTGDGGMITTSNADYDSRLRKLRQHGMGVSDTARHSSKTVVFERYDTVGYNYRLTDVQASIGRVQLTRLPEMIRRRRLLAQRYRELLSDIPGVVTPVEPSWARSNWQSYCVRLPRGCDQFRLMQHMLDSGVATRRGVMCIHREAPYENLGCSDRLGESEIAQNQSVVLPIFHEMSDDDQRRVAHIFREAINA